MEVREALLESRPPALDSVDSRASLCRKVEAAGASFSLSL